MLAGRLELSTRRFEVVPVPVPEPGPGTVRIKVAAAGVCMSDVHLIDGTLTPAHLEEDVVTLGHEVAGTIDAVGPGVERWWPGQRVLLQAGQRDERGRVLTRGVDYDGGWAEYAIATADTVLAVPDDLPLEQACIIPDAVSTPWAAITRTGRVRPGEATGVWGVGGLGAHAVQLLRLVGAAPIIAVEPRPAARQLALQLGADAALDPAADGLCARVQALTDGHGLAVAFDFAGVPAARDQARTLLGRDGRLVLVGIGNVPITLGPDTVFNHLRLSVHGHYGSGPEHVARLVALARRHRLDLRRSVSDVLPLSAAAGAVARLQSRQDSPIRLVLRP